MRIDNVEMPRTLADTEKMAKCIPFKGNDNVQFYRKIQKRFTVLRAYTISISYNTSFSGCR